MTTILQRDECYVRMLSLISALLINTGLAAQVVSAPVTDLLEDMVGTWQTDTVAGTSVHYACERSPEGAALICDEAISRRGGVEHAIGVYVVDSLPDRYTYFEVSSGGPPAPPMRVVITGHIWTFGGDKVGEDGSYHRTLHDYTAANGTFSWRKESSRDGVHWTIDRRGTVHRQRPLVPAADARN
jgi:hypothetical protein